MHTNCRVYSTDHAPRAVPMLQYQLPSDASPTAKMQMMPSQHQEGIKNPTGVLY
jgi:hypothetical protein